jgi:hypothetical protein
MWFAAFVALGTIYHWPSVLVLIKPTLAPFALVGIRHRSWWIALAALAVVSLVFLPMWQDWLAVTLNARGPYVSPFYSWQQVPLMLSPLVARWATTRSSAAPAAADTTQIVGDTAARWVPAGAASLGLEAPGQPLPRDPDFRNAGGIWIAEERAARRAGW